MPELNEKQKEIAETTDGLILVDAGPGTGKTHTITERYVNLMKNEVDPSDVLMVTFTINAANEMHDRIRKGLIESGNALKEAEEPDEEKKAEKNATGDMLLEACKGIRTSTFDAYCLRIVLSAPEVVSEFFGFRETLSRGAVLADNDSMNREYFASFYAEFSRKNGRHYRGEQDYPALMAENVDDLYRMLVTLMSHGIIPLADDDWFADGKEKLMGDAGEAFKILRKANGKKLATLNPSNSDKQWAPVLPPELSTKGAAGADTVLPDELLMDVVEEDRKNFLYFVRHVYYEYIRQAVRDNRLTFSLVKIFAFAVLYQSAYVREQNSVDYLMVDEFQDTDELQLMICLMLLRKNNLCVVGDWKQGIYGFRNASVDNILKFEAKVLDFAERLGDRIAFGPGDLKVKKISLEENYRSTDMILKPAFRAMIAPGSGEDVVTVKSEDLTVLNPHKESDEEEHSELYRKYTGCEFWYSDDKELEYEDIADKILEYVYSGNYSIVEEDGTIRPPHFGDIGVLFREIKGCTSLYEVTRQRGIPAFLQGDMEVMSSVPGKLALAWLRFINDPNDKRGISAILVYLGFTLPQIKAMTDKDEEGGKSIIERLPANLVKERDYLAKKKRRPNDLLTSIFAFHRIGDGDRYSDIVQAIVGIVSSTYNGSLVTIPDIIRLFEEDIATSRRYDVDAILGTGAVTIQTMHKSKGLEYPIVIVGGINSGKMPNTNGDTSILRYDSVFGLRCRKEFVQSGQGMEGIVDSWRAQVISNASSSDYDEERRLMFVSMSRAKQYMFVAAGPNPSMFYKFLKGEGVRDVRPKKGYEVRPGDGNDMTSPVPDKPVYTRRRRNVSVHDIMEYKEGADGGKGKEYGNRVHEAAQQMALGLKYDETLPETDVIAMVLGGLGGADLKTEYDCALPVGDVTLRGVIDLMADYGDRIDIYDWKTDVDTRNYDSYAVQLSVYAHAAAQARNVPVRCFIVFLSQEKPVREVTVVPMEDIASRVEDFLTAAEKVDLKQ